MNVAPLSAGHKTNITAVETALTAAIDSLTAPGDSYQAGTKAVLVRLRQQLQAQLLIYRSQ